MFFLLSASSSSSSSRPNRTSGRMAVWLLLAASVDMLSGEVDNNIMFIRLVRVTSEVQESRNGYVTGEVSAEIQLKPEVVVQSFWSKVIWNGLEQKDENSTSVRSYYEVPVSGDSWCTISESIWTEASIKHVTSTLKCHHLANEGELILILTLRTLDGDVQLRTPIRPLPNLVPPEYPIVPLYYTSTEHLLRSSSALDLKYSFEIQDNVTILARLLVRRDETSEVTEEFVLTNTSSEVYNFERFACAHNFTRNIYTLVFKLSNFDRKYHHYHLKISFGIILNREFSQSLEFSTDFASSNVETRRIFVRSCSGQDPGISNLRFIFRHGRPDCILCSAYGWSSLERMDVVRVFDGVSLGTEEGHSVFYNRVSSFNFTLVFMIRLPNEEYDGEYECVVEDNSRTVNRRKENRIRFNIAVT